MISPKYWLLKSGGCQPPTSFCRVAAAGSKHKISERSYPGCALVVLTHRTRIAHTSHTKRIRPCNDPGIICRHPSHCITTTEGNNPDTLRLLPGLEPCWYCSRSENAIPGALSCSSRIKLPVLLLCTRACVLVHDIEAMVDEDFSVLSTLSSLPRGST